MSIRKVALFVSLSLLELREALQPGVAAAEPVR